MAEKSSSDGAPAAHHAVDSNNGRISMWRGWFRTTRDPSQRLSGRDKGASPSAGGGVNQGVINVIENPLMRTTPEQTFANAQEFAEKHGMSEKAELFGRAALVARDPQRFETISDLHNDEKEALVYERGHKWNGPVMMWYTIGLCAVGAATQGWDQTGSNGANLSFPDDFGLKPKEIARDDWIVGLINAIIFLTAGLIGPWIVDPLNHYFGRRGEIFITAMCLTATPIASAFAKDWQSLFAARFIMGIGIGAKNATVPIFSAEVAPARVRGALVMFWQLWVVAAYIFVTGLPAGDLANMGGGIFLGFAANVIVKDVPKISWRLQLGSAFIPSFVLLVGVFFCPESPRWLMKKGRIAEGFRSMDRLRSHSIIAARDYYYACVIYEEEIREASGAGYFDRLFDCFRVPRIRRSNYGASTVMLAQQLCGINIISFYSSSIFRDVGYTEDEALYASLGYGAIQVVSTIPTLFLIDTKGRRTLCLITFPLMCIFLLAGGLSLLNPVDPEVNRAAKIGPVVLFVYLFTIAYSLGEGPIAFQYSAEVFPNIQREQGMAWAVCVNNTFAGILSLTFPRMRSVMTETGAFGFYAGLNLVAWFMVFCFLRETKQLTLEELDQVFAVPTKQYISHELTVMVPWFIKKYILFQKVAKPPAIIAKAENSPPGVP